MDSWLLRCFSDVVGMTIMWENINLAEYPSPRGHVELILCSFSCLPVITTGTGSAQTSCKEGMRVCVERSSLRWATRW